MLDQTFGTTWGISGGTVTDGDTATDVAPAGDAAPVEQPASGTLDTMVGDVPSTASATPPALRISPATSTRSTTSRCASTGGRRSSRRSGRPSRRGAAAAAIGARLTAQLRSEHSAPAQTDVTGTQVRFKPSSQCEKPYVMLGFNAFVADTAAVTIAAPTPARADSFVDLLQNALAGWLRDWFPPEPLPGPDFAAEFLREVRALCDKYGILLIIDEVKTGCTISAGGATARFGVTPDMITLAKASCGGRFSMAGW